MKRLSGSFLRRASFSKALISVLLFALSAVGTWIGLSSPLLPASEQNAKNAEHGEEKTVEKKDEKTRKPASLDAREQCLTDETAIADIQRRRGELEAKEKELESRLSELEVKEKAIQEQLKKIELVREDIKKRDELRSQQQSGKVGKVVETFETMTPKSVSAMLAMMDEDLAVEAMNRISTPKLAKVLNLMEPGKSARLTERLVGVRPELQSKDSSSRLSREDEKTAPVQSDEVSGRNPATEETSDSMER